MSFLQKSLHTGIATYLAAMLCTLILALIKVDFTGYEVGRIGLIVIFVTTGSVALRFVNGLKRYMKRSF